VGLSDQLRVVKVFVVVRIRLEPLERPFLGGRLELLLGLLGRYDIGLLLGRGSYSIRDGSPGRCSSSG
jgi:hypothetical protein